LVRVFCLIGSEQIFTGVGQIGNVARHAHLPSLPKAYIIKSFYTASAQIRHVQITNHAHAEKAAASIAPKYTLRCSQEADVGAIRSKLYRGYDRVMDFSRPSQ